jgi:hypothetical protein
MSHSEPSNAAIEIFPSMFPLWPFSGEPTEKTTGRLQIFKITS